MDQCTLLFYPLFVLNRASTTVAVAAGGVGSDRDRVAIPFGNRRANICARGNRDR